MTASTARRAHRCQCGELHHPGAKRKRPKRPVDAAAIRGMLGRMLNAYGERVAGDEADQRTEGVEALEHLVSMRAELERQITASVHRLRAEHGTSWSQLAEVLRVTRRAVIMRYGPSGSHRAEAEP